MLKASGKLVEYLRLYCFIARDFCGLLPFLYFEWVIPSKVADLFLMFGGQSNGSIWNATLHITWVICREQNDSSMSECLLACFWLHPHFLGL